MASLHKDIEYARGVVGPVAGRSYSDFLTSKLRRPHDFGFDPIALPDFLFDFQRLLCEWSIKLGRAALFEDCGLGKTPQQLVWADNVVRKTNGHVLILTPLAVAAQTVREGNKFGIEVEQSRDGAYKSKIVVTNYQRLHYFDPADFVGVVCDESSILKNFDGKTRRQITEFIKGMRYRLLCTATPSPNDFMELGTSSEALSVMSYSQMLGMFFVNSGDTTSQWEIKPHAKRRFWRWMGTWARAIRKPSDMGCDDSEFVLPDLVSRQYKVKAGKPYNSIFPPQAETLNAQREERKLTLSDRCEKVAEIVSELPSDRPFIAWGHLNAETDLLTQLIPEAVQVAGSDRDDLKEDRLNAFTNGEIRVLVTKPKIACFGMNWQHCSDMSFFPSHSYEQYYQAVRRCYRFGQDNPVTVNVVTSEAEMNVLNNMRDKESKAASMFDGIVREMGKYMKRDVTDHTEKVRLPQWL